MPRIWNSGRLVFKGLLAIFNFIANTNFIINQILHYPRTHHSNWGEAPKLFQYDRFVVNYDYPKISSTFFINSNGLKGLVK